MRWLTPAARGDVGHRRGGEPPDGERPDAASRIEPRALDATETARRPDVAGGLERGHRVAAELQAGVVPAEDPVVGDDLDRRHVGLVVPRVASGIAARGVRNVGVLRVEGDRHPREQLGIVDDRACPVRWTPRSSAQR